MRIIGLLFVVSLLFFTLFIVGCSGAEDAIFMSGFNSLLDGDSSARSSMRDSSTASNSVNPDSVNIKCGSNEFYNVDKGACDCVDGYFMQNGRCVPESSKECVFDADCSPSGVASVCKDKYTKQVYRCDLRTNKCVNGKGMVAETIDCRVDFGKNAVCQGGSCMSYNPYNPVQP